MVQLQPGLPRQAQGIPTALIALTWDTVQLCTPHNYYTLYCTVEKFLSLLHQYYRFQQFWLQHTCEEVSIHVGSVHLRRCQQKTEKETIPSRFKQIRLVKRDSDPHNSQKYHARHSLANFSNHSFFLMPSAKYRDPLLERNVLQPIQLLQSGKKMTPENSPEIFKLLFFLLALNKLPIPPHSSSHLNHTREMSFCPTQLLFFLSPYNGNSIGEFAALGQNCLKQSKSVDMYRKLQISSVCDSQMFFTFILGRTGSMYQSIIVSFQSPILNSHKLRIYFLSLLPVHCQRI